MGALEDAYGQAQEQNLKGFYDSIGSKDTKGLDVAPAAPLAVAGKSAAQPQPEAPPVGAITYGWNVGKQTAGIGANNVVEGLNEMLAGGEGGRTRVRGAARTLEGLYQMGLSPIVGLGGSVGDTFAKAFPELSKSNVLAEGQIPGVIRTMLNPFGSIATMLESPESIGKMTDEQLKAFQEKLAGYSKPFTMRDAVETAASIALPIAAAVRFGGKKKAGEEPVGKEPTPAEVLTPEDIQGFIDKTKAEPVEPVAPLTPEPPKPLAINWDELGTRESVGRALVRANRLRDDNVTNFTVDRLASETDIPTLQGYKQALDRQVDAAMEKSKGFADPDVNASLALANFASERMKQLAEPARPDMATPPMAHVDEVVTRMNAEQPSETSQAMMQRLNDNIGKPAARSWGTSFYNAAKNGTNAAFEYWMGGMLSSPTTWAKKLISDEGMTISALPERALMRMNHVLFFADDVKGTAPGEAAAMAHGWLQGTKTVIGALANREALADLPGADVYVGKPTLANPTGITQRSWGDPAITAEKLGVDRIPILSGATDIAGSLVRIGPNVLKNITRIEAARNFAMEQAAQQVREAHLETAQAGKAVEALGGHVDSASYSAHVVDRLQYIKDRPWEYPTIERAAAEAGNYRTFMRPLGARAEGFMDFISGTPLRVNMPFYRVPINFGKEAFYMFPPTWMASRIWGEMGREWAAGGARREAALAKLEMGALITGAMASWAVMDRTTGGGPTDPGLRESWLGTGRRPYTFYPDGIKPGAEGVSIHSIAPWGLVAGAVQDISEIWGQIPSGTDLADKALNIGAALTLGVVKSIDNESIFNGWANFLNAVHQPLLNLNTYLKGLASSAVPAGWKKIQSVYLDQAVKEVRDPLDRLRADVWRPGAVDRKDHITGEPMLYPAGLGPDIASPFTLSEIKNDIVAHELWDNQIKVQRLPWVVAGNRNPAEFVQLGPQMPTEGIPLTGMQRDRWVDLMTNYKGDGVTVGGRNLHDTLEKIILSTQYQRLPSGPESPARQNQLGPVMSAFREKARLMLLREDVDLAARSALQERERLQKQLPVTNPRSLGVQRPGTFNLGGMPQ